MPPSRRRTSCHRQFLLGEQVLVHGATLEPYRPALLPPGNSERRPAASHPEAVINSRSQAMRADGNPILLTLPQVSSVCALYAQSYVIRTPFLWAQVFTRYIDPSIRSRRSGPGGRRRGAGAVIIGCCSDPVFKDARRASVLPAVGLPQAGASVAGSRERNPGIVPTSMRSGSPLIGFDTTWKLTAFPT